MGEILYLAGPMSGIPQFNFPFFMKVALELRSMGYCITSPAELDDGTDYEAAMNSPDGAPGSTEKTWGDYLARDVKLLSDECSGIILLPGWQDSRGARLECFVAITCGKKLYCYQPDMAKRVYSMPPLLCMSMISKHLMQDRKAMEVDQ